MSGLGSATIPEQLVPGSVEAAYEVSHVARRREEVAGQVSADLRRLVSVDGWTGEGADAYAARMTAVAQRWREIGQGMAAVVEPLRTYALALRRAQGLAAAAIEAWSFASTLPEDAAAATQAFTSFTSGWPVFITDPRHQGPAPVTRADGRRRAEAMLIDARADVAEAGEVAARAVRAAMDQVRARGDVWASVGAGLGVPAVTSARVLDVLQSLDPRALTILLRARPDLLTRLSQTAAEDVAPWWRRLTAEQQNALIAESPGVIGTLGGVAYSARDRANRIVLARALDEARNSPLDESEQVRALEALERAAIGNTLVSLVLDRPPLAQVAVGDLDRAEHVSVIVPGMGTTVGNDIESYVRFAGAFAAEQAQLALVDPGSIGVVAWIGYHPPMPDSHALDVASDIKAEAGASLLAEDLRGLRATAANGAGINLSVIAHSYGTDVAALALRRADADHLVLLGSAGIADQVGGASNLNVPEGQVFASQAQLDGWAPIGQALSQRTDPTSPDFGARVFSSEAATVDGRVLFAVGKHGPFGTESMLNASYLTSNTTAMYNAALATMGINKRLVMGGAPEDRIIENGEKWVGGSF